MKSVAVLLSGCGYKDGAEITESVSTFIALSAHDVNYKVFALNKPFRALNHLTDEPMEERNILIEASRIARGQISSLEALDSGQFEGLVLPGGFGAALHFCDFARKGAKCNVDPLVEKLIKEFHGSSKPIAAFCIAPALIAKVLGEHSVAVTIGNDIGTAAQIEETGAQHVECAVDDYVSDRENKLITSPAYMYEEAAPHLVFSGISKAIKEFVTMS